MTKAAFGDIYIESAPHHLSLGFGGHHVRKETGCPGRFPGKPEAADPEGMVPGPEREVLVDRVHRGVQRNEAKVSSNPARCRLLFTIFGPMGLQQLVLVSLLFFSLLKNSF